MKWLLVFVFCLTIFSSSVLAYDFDPNNLSNYLVSEILSGPQFSVEEQINYSIALRHLRIQSTLEAERRLFAIHTPSADVANLMGIVQSMRGKRELAHNYFAQARGIDGSRLSPWINQGILYHHQKAWNQLGELSLQLLENMPNSGDAWLGVGIAEYHAHHFQEAASKLQRARDIMKHNKNPRLNVAREYLQRVHSKRRRFFNFGTKQKN
jgi:tetratricopeptide (TPR) repeat protein